MPTLALVHGTHDTDPAGWSRPGSAFVRMLEREGFRITMPPPEWTGDVGQFWWDRRDWDAGASGFRDHLALHRPDGVIAFSHGGAVALKAALLIRMPPLITIATPVRQEIRAVAREAMARGHLPAWRHLYDPGFDIWQFLGGGRGGFRLPRMVDHAVPGVGHGRVLREQRERWVAGGWLRFFTAAHPEAA